MSKLYELTGQIRELNDLADDPELVEAVQDTLEGLEGMFSSKVEGIAHILRERELQVEAITKEIDRLTARKKTLENFRSSLTDYLRINMLASNIPRVECALFTVKIVAGRDVAVIDNDDEIPDDYVSVSIEARPMRKEILKALQAGEELPGAHIEKSRPTVRIS